MVLGSFAIVQFYLLGMFSSYSYLYFKAQIVPWMLSPLIVSISFLPSVRLAFLECVERTIADAAPFHPGFQKHYKVAHDLSHCDM